MTTILLDSELHGSREFQEVLRAQGLGAHVALSSENIDLADVEVAIIWLSAPDYLQSLINLKLLLICGSGVDHLVHELGLTQEVRVVRLVDPFLREHVSSYVVQAIEHHIAGKPILRPSIGIMGLGLVGATTAARLSRMGYDVIGWVRTPGPRVVKAYVGRNELRDFASRSEILVCQLPLTCETRGILNCDLFQLLPDGAYLINVGRGGHLNEGDLQSMLASGKLRGACLDVLEGERLPADHWLQQHRNVIITPHVAGVLKPAEQAKYAARIITRFYGGDALEGIVDFHVRY